MENEPARDYILELGSPEATIERVGGKGASLARMVAAGLPVPPGFHITTAAYRRVMDENFLSPDAAMPEEIAAAIRHWYGELGVDAGVAVRSSATVEDSPGTSFAGQLETYLNVRGAENVIQSVKRCWASLGSARAIHYCERQGIRAEDIGIAVVVQQLISADAAGVMFSANPVTGARDELIINAAWGLGEAIVSGRVTPDTIVVNKQTGAIISQEIADKDVMTVRLDDGTREEPVPAEKRKRAALEPAQAAQLAQLGMKIEQLYGQPMDTEWALGDGRIFILQARPVTALPESHPALEWRMPREGRQYWRSSVAELLPDPLSPLFATLALPLWNEATQAMMQAAGVQLLKGEDFGLVRINDYAYYDFKLSGWQLARLVLMLPMLIPRFVRVSRSARARWSEETKRYARLAGTWKGRDLVSMPALELLTGVRAITEAAANYYVSIQNVLPLANISESIFTVVYNRVIKRNGDPPALTFLLGFDSEPIQAEKSLYDLARWAGCNRELSAYLSRTSSHEVAVAYLTQSTPIADRGSWLEFTGRFAEHLKQFGYAVYDLDFAKSVPAEDPAALVETLKYFMAEQVRSPYERQAATALARMHAADAVLARLRGLRLRWFKRLLAWAQSCVPLREDALAGVGLGWPVLRSMLLEVGRRMAASGAIAECDHVFWLTWDEVEEIAQDLDGARPAQDYRHTINQRREIWKREHAARPPVVLPVKGGARLAGLDLARWLPARSAQSENGIIKGIGASPGRVTGPACVIQGPEEFDRMKPGDILIAKITTPAWTPLFALASGIVTDVGGPLSHSSIVAREYGVPAVLGTGVATQRIHGGQQVTVDGDGGVVTMRG